MDEIFSNAQSILDFVVTLLGSTGIIGTITGAIVCYGKNKKYIASLAANTAKDKQIAAMETKVDEQNKAIGLLASAMSVQQLASYSLSDESKKKLVTIYSSIEKLTSVNLDETVASALDALSVISPDAVTEEKKQAILEKTNSVQKVLDTTNETAENIINKMRI